MRFLVFALFLVIVRQNVEAQNMRPYDEEMQRKHAELKGYDPNYRVNYFENIILRTMITTNLSRLEYTSGVSKLPVDLRPAAKYQLGFSADYKFLAIGISFTPSFLLDTKNLEELEKSESYSVSLNFFYSDQWRQELGFSYNKGFFNDNGVTDAPTYANTSISTIEGSTFYIANNNFSYRAHYAQTERQLQSAGSLVPRIRYAFSVFKPNIMTFESTGSTKTINSFDFLAQLGYLYTFVYHKKWFATVGAHPGIGYNISRYNYESNIKKDETFNNVSLLFSSGLNIGYNSYRWFFGLSYDYRNYNASNNLQEDFSSDTNVFSVYLGYRLNDNKPMRKFFGWFEDTFGF